jgi:hypothetical protein
LFELPFGEAMHREARAAQIEVSRMVVLKSDRPAVVSEAIGLHL